MTTRLFDCYTDDELLSSSLVFFPVYTSKYYYRGKSFRVTMDGTSGTVMKAELPMTLALRIGYAIMGYAGISLSIISSLLLFEENGFFVGIAGVVGGFAVVAWSFLRATAEQRIKRS